jgi:hypothetical protein
MQYEGTCFQFLVGNGGAVRMPFWICGANERALAVDVGG